MEAPLKILLFGDQTEDSIALLQNLGQSKDNIFLKAFLDKAYFVLREEVSQQPSSVKDCIPKFNSIPDLLARYSEPIASKYNGLESALTCISQLANFISYQSTQDEVYPSASHTRVVGSCTGLLAAAAVASSNSLGGLLLVAAETVKLAFRLGVAVAEAGAEICQNTLRFSSWSMIIPGLKFEKAKEMLQSYNNEAAIPPSSRIFISAISSNGVTISGPPHLLDQLNQSGELKALKPVRLQILGPYHAQHLIDGYELSKFYESISADILDSHQLRFPLSSTSSKKWHTNTSFRSLIPEVVQDILVNTLRWDYVLENVVSEVREASNSKCNIVHLGNSGAGRSLLSALRQNDDLEISSDERFANHETTSSEAQRSSGATHSKIAICGLSGRFPDAADHEAFWKLLEKGLDLHREVPAYRFNVKTHVDADGKRKNTSHTPYGCFIEDPGLFDPGFFNISPREAAQTDPMHRLALVTAYEALEMSGYVANRTPSTQLDRIGTFYGQTSDDYRETQAAQEVDTYFIPGGVRAFAPGRINYYFNFSGPSFSIDTACSSSLAAIQLACTSLLAFDCDTALAGGMNIMSNPDMFSGLSRGQFLSKKGPCATFDDEADGYCRADGVGSIVLKRLEDAEADKDPILGVILGVATNHSAEAISITHPHAGAQEFLCKQVLNRAHVDPLDVSYVEMHGTGTQAGDSTEMRSVTNVFAPEHRRRRPDQSLHLGAVKANAGHAEAASGTASLIKVLMMMEKDLIPPHCGIKGTINHTFPSNLSDRNVHIPFEATAWKKKDGSKRRVFINNFSAAGGNTALLLEDSSVKPPVDGSSDKRTRHTVAVTGRSKLSLRKNVDNLIRHLERHPEVNLSSVSYSTTARRTQHDLRATVSAATREGIVESLKACLNKDISKITKTPPKVTFMFTGQGSHYISMAKLIYESSPQFRSSIDKFDKIAKIQGFPSIMPLIDGTVTDLATLSPLLVQLGAICVQMALYRLYASWGVKPTVVVGHSLGEYAALNAAGVLSVADTIFIVGTRAKLMQENCHTGSHSMLAIKASVATLSRVIDFGACEIACLNAPEETVLSGTNINIDMLMDGMKEHGFKATKLAVPFAYHSAQVEPFLDGFERAARGITFNKPTVPVISPLLNKIVEDQVTFNSAYLRDHCRKTVNFLGGLEAAKHADLVNDNSLWVEIGSHPTCSSMVKATMGPQAKTVASLRRNEDDWKIITNSLCTLHDAGLGIDWSQYHKEYDSCHEYLRLPTYAWDNRNFWIQYANDWMLYKGNTEALAELEDPKLKFTSTSVHRIIERDLEGDVATIVGQSDLTEPLLKEVMEGHEVNGFALCPPSLYADMVLNLAKFLYEQLHPDATAFDMNVVNMQVQKPLIVFDTSSQLLRMAGTHDKISNLVNFEFYSVDADGRKTNAHAVCGLKFEKAQEWLDGWKRNTFMIKDRIENLLQGIQDSDNDLIKRGTAYKLFGGLIHYSHKFRGMEEVVLNSRDLEATASVSFQTDNTDAGFICSPYRTDSVAHISGFTMIANNNADNTKEVYVSQGWDTYRVAEPLSMDKKYRSYVKMQHEGPKTVVGDVYVFDGDRIIGVVEGLRFHALPRQLMDSHLSAAGGKSQVTKPMALPANVMPKPPAHSMLKHKPVSAKDPPHPPAKVPMPPKASNTGITSRALSIIADEVGMPTSDLTEDAVFSDLGVDSLLSLSILGKLREELDVEMASTVLVDNPTVKEFKAYLARNETLEQPRDSSPGVSSSPSTPSLSTTSDEVSSASSQQTTVNEAEAQLPSKADEGGTAAAIRSTAAQELGVEVAEIEKSSDLSSLGLDSLMALSVLGKLRDESGIDLPPDFFVQNPTFAQIAAAVGTRSTDQGLTTPFTQNASDMTVEAAPEAIIETASHATDKSAPTEESISARVKVSSYSSHAPKPQAMSILLQGSPKTASKSLFLFPDGSGSATSYAPLPSISPTLALYALNSPFLKEPSALSNSSVSAVASLYIDEILRRQPDGPYYLGGWSGGGVWAYEATLQLQALGKQVERLVLLDTPCPSDLSILPSNLHSWFDSIGLLGTEDTKQRGKSPEWLIPHFGASLRCMDSYNPPKMEASPVAPLPRISILWAKDGVCKYPTDPRPQLERGVKQPKNMAWLLENREGEQLRKNGWDGLFGKQCIFETRVLEGANHFSMMRGENAKQVAEFIGEAMD